MTPILRLLRTYAWPYRWSFLGGGLCLLLTNWLTVTIPLKIGAAIDALSEGQDPLPAIAAIAAMGATVILVRTLSRVWIFNPGRDLEYHLRGDLFARLMAQQPSFYATRQTGDIVSRASNDISFVRALAGFGMMQLINATAAISLTCWRMVTLSWELTLWVLLPVLVGLAATRFAIGYVFDLHHKAQAQVSEISEHVLGSLQGIATIQGFVAESAFRARFSGRNEALFVTRMKMSGLAALAFPVLPLAGSIALFAVLYVGGPMAISGELSVGDVAAFAALLGVLVPPLRSLGWMLSVLRRGQASLERIFELMDAPLDRPEGASPAPLPDAPGGPAIALRGLSFAYPDAPDHPVLKDIHAEIPAGSVVGVFGRTGSGKTTLLRVLARLYNPPAGTVFAGGTDLTRLDLDAWRTRLAVAPQRPFLFSHAISTNIATGGDPSPDATQRSAERAALGPDLAALPEGMDTVVGERGVMLSGGQRQRVALARALHRGGELILLDDVLSAVDHTAEHRLVEMLRGLGDGSARPTVIIVSHRLSALQHTDLVLVLEEGRLRETGTHVELVDREGPYRKTWLSQQSDDAPAEVSA